MSTPAAFERIRIGIPCATSPPISTREGRAVRCKWLDRKAGEPVDGCRLQIRRCCRASQGLQDYTDQPIQWPNCSSPHEGSDQQLTGYYRWRRVPKSAMSMRVDALIFVFLFLFAPASLVALSSAPAHAQKHHHAPGEPSSDPPRDGRAKTPLDRNIPASQTEKERGYLHLPDHGEPAMKIIHVLLLLGVLMMTGCATRMT